MSHMLRLIILCGFIIIAACQFNSSSAVATVDPTLLPATGPVSISPTASSLEGNPPQMTPSSSTPMDSALQALIEKAKEDLAQRINISTSKIRVVDAAEVEWSDSSLGCPQPGMSYLQVISPGYRIVLEASGTHYEYHSNKSTLIIFCENPNPVS